MDGDDIWVIQARQNAGFCDVAFDVGDSMRKWNLDRDQTIQDFVPPKIDNSETAFAQ